MEIVLALVEDWVLSTLRYSQFLKTMTEIVLIHGTGGNRG